MFLFEKRMDLMPKFFKSGINLVLIYRCKFFPLPKE